MENQQSNSAESGTKKSLKLTKEIEAHFTETAKWAKFLAIVSFVVWGMAVISSFISGYFLATMNGYPEDTAFLIGGGMGFFCVAILLLYFMPNLYLYRFATEMNNAQQTRSHEDFLESFENLKRVFKFSGRLIVVSLILTFILPMIATIIMNK